MSIASAMLGAVEGWWRLDGEREVSRIEDLKAEGTEGV